jgi:hypothetical protein
VEGIAMKYKVGDVVLLKVEIAHVDPSDRKHSYIAKDKAGFWFQDDDVFAVVPNAEEPAKPETKFKVDDRVIHRNMPEWGIGKVKAVCNRNLENAREYTSPGVENHHVNEPGPIYTVYFRHGEKGFENWYTVEKFLVPVVE